MIANFKKKFKKLRKNQYQIAFFIITIIYTFFFSSIYWFPKGYTGVNTSDVGKLYNIDDINIKIQSINYSNEEKIIEFILTVEDIKIEKKNKYKFAIADRYGKMKTEKTFSKGDFFVITARGVPKDFKEIVLGIFPDQDNSNVIKLYFNDKQIKRVKKIKKLDYLGYVEKGKQGLVSSYEEQIKKRQDEVALLKKEVLAATKKIDELDKRIERVAEDEIEVITRQMRELSTYKDENEQKIERKEEEIRILKDNIKLINKEG